MTRAPAALLLVLLASCAPPWTGHAGMGWRWKDEPTVGVSTPELAQPVAHALERWGYGRQVSGCRGADVCVIRGQRNHAGPRGRRCVAEVDTAAWYVVAHEIGHCYGLPHSDDPASVMHGYSRPGQDVTTEDRRALR